MLRQWTTSLIRQSLPWAPEAQINRFCQVRLVSSSKRPPLPPIPESDIEETFVRGSGPGGQSINKTNISVSLVHKPTGIRVQCHQTRSRVWNRSLARKILRERVDLELNPGASKLESQWSKEASKKAAQARKRRRKAEKETAGITAVLQEASGAEEGDTQEPVVEKRPKSVGANAALPDG